MSTEQPRPETVRDGEAGQRSRPARRGRQPGHSLEAILDTAIAMLDRDGLSGLTFRSLAAELDAGVGSIYWYVRGKDELIALAADAVVGRVLQDVRRVQIGELEPAQVGADGDAPSAERERVSAALIEVRRICVVLYRQMETHPWLAPQLQRGNALQRNSLRLWDQVGQQLAAMGLTPVQQFHGASALVNFVTGMGAELSYHDEFAHAIAEGRTKDEMTDEMVSAWLAGDAADLPFVHSIADLFRKHDDFDQFAGGLDLMLVGLREQASSRPS